MSDAKLCKGCNQEKTLDNFWKRNDRPCGYQAQCKECQGKANEKWRQDNEEAERERHKQYRQENRKSRVSQSRAYYWADPERERERKRKERDGKSTKESQAAWVESNPDKRKAHEAVRAAIYNGILPPIKTVRCQCGNQADIYHHHLGYDEKNYLSVVPLCTKCHGEEHRTPL